MVWDATFVSPIVRASVLHIANGAGFTTKAIFFDVDVEVCAFSEKFRKRPRTRRRVQSDECTMVLWNLQKKKVLMKWFIAELA